MNFFSGMYDDIRRADFYDSGYMFAGLILSGIISITTIVISIIVLIQPADLSGDLLKWAQSEYRFLAWVFIACVLIGWAIFCSYITVVENRQKAIKTYSLTANILYYFHHILTGSGLVMLPIALIVNIFYYIGKFIAVSTTFVMQLPTCISNAKARPIMLNAEVHDKIVSTFDDFNRFLR